MPYVTINQHDFNDSGICENCHKDFMDVEGEVCLQPPTKVKPGVLK